MTSPDSTGRILRIEVPSKPCVVPGCAGTMHFHERLEVAKAPHTLEWPWYASWQCTKDSAHIELISGAGNAR